MRRISIQLTVPVNLKLWLDKPYDPEEGVGWQVIDAEVDPIQGLSADDIYASCSESDFEEIDRRANEATDQ